MKTVGLIAEYNPFHNGHLYHIEKSKEITGADRVIVIMSGDYVQRGVPAVMPKYLRAKAALKCGASAVFELPVCYSCGSAELFAAGAVSLLEKIGVVDCLCFGSECGDIKKLKKAADFLCDEPKEYKELLRRNLKTGMSFPLARQQAAACTLKSTSLCTLFEEPNNILGIEYLKAIKKLGSKIEPYSILRKGTGYNETELSSKYSSASAIRSAFERMDSIGALTVLKEQIPKACIELLKKFYHISYPVWQDDFSLLLKSKLLGKTSEELKEYMDVSEELANKILNKLELFLGFSQFSGLLKSKEITQSRINRALLHVLLGIKKDDVSLYIKEGYHYYARLLGVRRDCEAILGEISGNGSVPLLTSLNKTDDIPEHGRSMLLRDILASELYRSVVTDKYKTAFRSEYHHAVIKK